MVTRNGIVSLVVVVLFATTIQGQAPHIPHAPPPPHHHHHHHHAPPPAPGPVPGALPPPAAGPPLPGGPHPGPAGAPPPPGMMGMGYSQVQSSHCRYLIDAPSPWGTNASPFKLFTRSHSGEIRRGHPVEVSILPFYDAFKFFNFTDFALWAEPHMVLGARPAVEPEKAAMMGPQPLPAVPPGPNDVTHLGVWQVFPKYAGGSSTLKCNVFTRGEDTVGSFEGRMLELLKMQFPYDGRLTHFHPSARHGAAFLWYPDESTMGTVVSVKFVAKLKSFGQWFKLESSPWRVYRPPPPPPSRRRAHYNHKNYNNMMDQTLEMVQNFAQMERKLERAQV
ncbi:hypothetical protein ACOMHN_019826 [Nucella lapillus]